MRTIEILSFATMMPFALFNAIVWFKNGWVVNRVFAAINIAVLCACIHMVYYLASF